MREGTIWAGLVSNVGIVDTGDGGPGGRKVKATSEGERVIGE